jgi:hypothetical protein
LLGALLREWEILQAFLEVPSAFTSEKDVKLVMEGQIEHFAKMRTLQKKLGIDDDMLLTAAGVSAEGKEKMKRQIADYESAVSRSRPAPTTWPNTVR